MQSIYEWGQQPLQKKENKQKWIKLAIVSFLILIGGIAFLTYGGEKVKIIRIEGLCNTTNMRVENPAVQIYDSLGIFKLQTTPYPNLKLLSKKGDPSPTYHFTELIPYFKKYPASNVYVHSASVYFVLMIGAYTT